MTPEEPCFRIVIILRSFSTISVFSSTSDAKSIFRELILEELRAGRLTPIRRSRIVRYASQIGLTAIEAGRLIAECS